MLDQAFEALQTFDWGSDLSQLQPIDEAIIASQGDHAARAELEQRLLKALENTGARAAQDYLFRQLMHVGTAAAVPALARFLNDADLSHMARFALERIPAEEAEAALREALGQVAGKLKIGVISSLAGRRDTASVSQLAAALSDPDPAVARAAAQALGTMRTTEAAQALTDAQPAAEVHDAVTDAALSCAEGLLAEGDKPAALAIYKRYAGENQAKHVRLAATRGMLACAR